MRKQALFCMLAIVVAVGAIILTVSVGLSVAAPERSLSVSSSQSIVRNVNDAATLQQNSVITQFVYWPVMVDGQLVTNTQGVLDVVGRDFLLQQIESDFGFRYLSSSRYHPAIDIRATHGTTVVAPLTGTVAYISDKANSGERFIVLKHGQDLHTVYFHIDHALVSYSRVQAGDPIAISGPPTDPEKNTNNHRFHLDFRVNKSNQLIPKDFKYWLNPIQFYLHLKDDEPHWSDVQVRRWGEVDYEKQEGIILSSQPIWVSAYLTTNDKDIVSVTVKLDDTLLYTYDYFQGRKKYNQSMFYVPFEDTNLHYPFVGEPISGLYDPLSVAYVSCPDDTPSAGEATEDYFYYRLELDPAPYSILRETLTEPGFHDIIFEAVDSAGNVGSTSIPIQLDPSLQ